ncbi:MAG: oligoendopeptidase F [Candidatus Sumerlaeia bacterium]|nr:oligoendopeptidase F [Candidatus Sumerlaeia bacterium]
MSPAAQATETQTIPDRSSLPLEDTWNLEAIYPTPEAWDADFQKLDELLQPVLAHQGKLHSPESLAALFDAEDALSLLLDRLYTYAHHREDENTKDATNQGRQQRMMGKYAHIASQTAWINPEILSKDEATLKAWRDSPVLEPYRYTLDVLLREKPHVLSDKEERLLSLAAELFQNPYNTFNFLTNADLTFPDVLDHTGKPQPLSNGRYVKFLENRDRGVRRTAFETFYDRYIGVENTLASTLAGKVKQDNFRAKVRNYPDALTAALKPKNIPTDLYSNLINAVHEALPLYHDYVDLRREVLGLETLDMWDQHVPIVPDFDLKVSWADAKLHVRESCKILGEEYMGAVDECFNNRWIDVHECKGKRSGAYSGGCYGTPNYILMNYQGNLNWVFTLAHELGHSLHSWLANKNQPYRYAGYTIFVAEIASTTNEALLHHHLMQTADDPRFRAYLLNHLCDSFKGTVFRQVMFAEFERMIHEMDAAGEPITAQSLSDAYYKLNAKYHGPAVKPDQRISHEWSRIPHFYYNFYVYQYATGFCAAQIFSQNILTSPEKRTNYLNFLRSGGSADPLDVVKRGGVDLLDSSVLTNAFSTFKACVTELRELLVK